LAEAAIACEKLLRMRDFHPTGAMIYCNVALEKTFGIAS
jgi:hypothetical protein